MSTLELENIKHPDNSGNNLTLTSGGNVAIAGGSVGIGISSPTQKLTVQEAHANAAVKDTLRLTTTGTYSSGNSEEAGAAISFGQFHNNYPTWQLGLITGIRDGNSWNGSLAFYTNTGSSATSITEKIRILGNGNVGIGTNTPNEKLQVAGNINAYDPSGINAALFASTAAGATPIALRSSGVTYFNGGNVGIGTTSPSSPLDITPDSSNKKTFRLHNASQTGYQEYVISGTIGANAVTVTMQCPSYFQSEVIATFQQSNGGADNNVYFNGIWSNNHTTHLFKNKTNGGTVPRIGSLGSATPAFTVGVGDAASNTGKLTFTKPAAGGTSGTYCIHVRAYGYGCTDMTFVVS